MALQSSGPITLSQIQAEFGGSNPIGLSEYYRNGSYTTSNNTGVPTSGAISMGADFYGTVKQFSHTITANQKELQLATYLTSVGWNGSDPVALTIDSSVWIWSDNTATAALTIPSSMNYLLSIINNGKIIGKGGAGGSYNSTDGKAGGPAISNSATGIILTNASGAYIAGGGGGGGATGSISSFGTSGRASGGGGAGGGAGGQGRYDDTGWSGGSIGYVNGGAGGAIGASGGNGGASWSGFYGNGGGAGGSGGTSRSTTSGDYVGAGGGGGRILPGTGGATPSAYQWPAGGAGGSGGSAGSSGGAGGGGGWGAAGGAGQGGGAGGAGGAAISGTSISVTNNGTVYGAVA